MKPDIRRTVATPTYETEGRKFTVNFIECDHGTEEDTKFILSHLEDFDISKTLHSQL